MASRYGGSLDVLTNTRVVPPSGNKPGRSAHSHSLTERDIRAVLKIRRAMTAQSVQRWAMGWTIGVLGFDSR
jgi:hypothetical protein